MTYHFKTEPLVIKVVPDIRNAQDCKETTRWAEVSKQGCYLYKLCCYRSYKHSKTSTVRESSLTGCMSPSGCKKIVSSCLRLFFLRKQLTACELYSKTLKLVFSPTAKCLAHTGGSPTNIYWMNECENKPISSSNAKLPELLLYWRYRGLPFPCLAFGTIAKRIWSHLVPIFF